MIVYLVLSTYPNPKRYTFCKTDKREVNKTLPYVGLLTEAQMMHIGGLLLTMATDDKIVLYRKSIDAGMEFMSVTQRSKIADLTEPHQVLAEIDRETLFDVKDYFHKGQTYYRSYANAEFVPAAVHDEVHMSRYAICWDDNVGPMPMNTQLYAKKSDVAKLSGNFLQQAGFKVHSADDRTGTLLMTHNDDGPTSH